MNTAKHILVFDGSLSGLFTSVFEAFERKLFDVSIVDEKDYQPVMFDEVLTIITDDVKAERVHNRLKQKIGNQDLRKVRAVFLSELAIAYQHIFNYCVYIFSHQQAVYTNYGHPDVLAIQQIAKNVSRERHRMKAFIRFKKLSDGTFFAVIHPDFNVIPLIIKHFRDRYTDQPWIIFDEKRGYGVYYNREQVIHISLHSWLEIYNNHLPTLHQSLDENELKYDQLWKDYFKSTNIKERKNGKLHIQHVPKRYWKYLTEKDINDL